MILVEARELIGMSDVLMYNMTQASVIKVEGDMVRFTVVSREWSQPYIYTLAATTRVALACPIERQHWIERIPETPDEG